MLLLSYWTMVCQKVNKAKMRKYALNFKSRGGAVIDNICISCWRKYTGNEVVDNTIKEN